MGCLLLSNVWSSSPNNNNVNNFIIINRASGSNSNNNANNSNGVLPGFCHSRFTVFARSRYPVSKYKAHDRRSAGEPRRDRQKESVTFCASQRSK